MDLLRSQVSWKKYRLSSFLETFASPKLLVDLHGTNFRGISSMALMKAFSEFSLESKEPLIKLGLSPFKKICVICFNESPLKMMKKAS